MGQEAKENKNNAKNENISTDEFFCQKCGATDWLGCICPEADISSTNQDENISTKKETDEFFCQKCGAENWLGCICPEADISSTNQNKKISTKCQPFKVPRRYGKTIY